MSSPAASDHSSEETISGLFGDTTLVSEMVTVNLLPISEEKGLQGMERSVLKHRLNCFLHDSSLVDSTR